MARHPLAEFIAAHPGLAEALLADHVDDGSGHCRGCALGAQRGHHRWPCTIAAAAEASTPGSRPPGTGAP